MRIAMVDPYFAVGLGYQPTGWFNAFVAQGHHVRAFCSCYTSTVARHLYDRPFEEGLAKVNGGEMLRMRVRLLPRDMVYCSGVLPKVLEFDPDLILATYPGTIFALPVIRNHARFRGLMVSAFGENSAQRHTSMRGAKEFLRNLMLDAAFFTIKRHFYCAAMEGSDVILLQTPDTFTHLLPRVAWGRRRQRIAERCVLSPLGFETAVFYVDEDERRAERARLGVADEEVLALYACKIMPEKRLDIWVELMAAAMRRVPRLRAMLIGFKEGDARCEQVRKWMDATGLRDRFICAAFAKREHLRGLANAADFGVWHLQPAVTIQEVMGTGLYMVLTDSSTVSHLVADPVTGRYFRHKDFAQAEELVVQTAEAFMEKGAITAVAARKRRAEINAGLFSYETMAAKLVAAAADPKHALERMRFTPARMQEHLSA
ncbi:MAG TPA: glycosyltransferase [Phycisphaerae bacterium]|nr:glycosyltransferase [Phycisphaerae bacterium]